MVEQKAVWKYIQPELTNTVSLAVQMICTVFEFFLECNVCRNRITKPVKFYPLKKKKGY